MTDTAGNTYEVAAPLARGTGISQAIYYARNIRPAGRCQRRSRSRSTGAVPYVDVRVTEYAGLDPGAIRSSRQRRRAGTIVAATSGNVTTTSPIALVFGAGMTTGVFTGAATGFTTRMITPIDADIVVDRNVASTGTYSAGGHQSGSSNWVMQVATFRAAGQ